MSDSDSNSDSGSESEIKILISLFCSAGCISRSPRKAGATGKSRTAPKKNIYIGGDL